MWDRFTNDDSRLEWQQEASIFFYARPEKAKFPHPPPPQVIPASDWSAIADKRPSLALVEAAKDPTSCASSRCLYQRRDGEQMAGTGVPGCAERDLLKPAFKKLTCSNKSARRHPGGGGVEGVCLPPAPPAPRDAAADRTETISWYLQLSYSGFM